MSWFLDFFRGRRIDEGELRLENEEPFTTQHVASVAPKSFPAFRGTAADQVRSKGGVLDKTRLRLRSAFTPSRPVKDTAMFAGRANVLTSLIRSIEDQRLHVVIFGTRGIGKTSTLHILRNVAQEAGYLVRYVSCGERTELDEMFRALLADIPLLFHEHYDPTADEIEEGLSFADLLGDSPLTVGLLSDLLAKVSGTRLLIVLDEFDRTPGSEFRRSIAELIKNLSDRDSRVQLIIAGVARNVTEIIEHIPSIRRNILALQLPGMDEREIGELLALGESASGIEFDVSALQIISRIALGLPYLASLFGQNAGLSALDRGDTKVLPLDVEKAVDQVLEELELRIPPTYRFQIERVYNDGRGKELGLIAALALQNGGLLSVPAVEATIAPPPAMGQEYLELLALQYGLTMLVQDDPSGAYTFADDGIPMYLWIRLGRDHGLHNEFSEPGGIST